MRLERGELVTESVRLSRKLGEGGMGTVWLADHLALHAPVVVKFLSHKLVAFDEAVVRFKREATAAAKIRSPHIVQVFDHGVTDDGLPYIVMEHLEGRHLKDFVAEHGGRLEPAALAPIVDQIAKALTKAHSAGVIHRDIKPENIFICGSDGEELFVKLLDFGIAKAPAVSLDVSTETGAILGTPHYMSPEQASSGKGVDARTDLWSLGVVVFEALTGTRPFDAADFGDLIVALRTQDPPKPSSRAPTLSPAIDAWFARACARRPGDRFRDAAEMARAFRRAVDGVSSPDGLDELGSDPGAEATSSRAIQVFVPATNPELRTPKASSGLGGVVATGLAVVVVGTIVYVALNDDAPAKRSTDRPAVTSVGAEPAKTIDLSTPLVAVSAPESSATGSIAPAGHIPLAHAAPSSAPKATPSASTAPVASVPARPAAADAGRRRYEDIE